MFQTHLPRSERGQMFMIFALLLPVLVGMAGMAVDLGGWASDRRSLQNAADSIALAAAQELPNEGQAHVAAHQWAANNDIDISQMTVEVSGGDVSPKVTVTLNRPHDFAFLPMLGIDSQDLGARAAAVKVSYGGGAGVVPWAVAESFVNAALAGDEVSPLITLKYDAPGADAGNFGAIRVDGSGSAVYLNDLMYGATSYMCADTTPECVTDSCPGTYPDVCTETAPQCDGPSCNTETGNMLGPTETGVDFRMNNTISSCDTFDEAFPIDPIDGTYHLAYGCNPWQPGSAGYCTTSTSLCSRRVIIIPIVDAFDNGMSQITVQGFALVWLEGYVGTCTGSNCDILGRFVKAEANINGIAGAYDPGSQIHFIKLVE